ncbi:MAG: protein tyrosine phosphatase [Streptosporangiaceae bacterium]|nr:protein tyrosine phosphatase [Streptosporangiaceae bacterium]
MSAPARPEARPYSVLVVCTANICRSPAAASLLEGALRSDGSVRVGSAGVRARAGAPFDADMASALGDELPNFTARQLTSAMIGESDLILTMTRIHRSAVVSSVPSAVRRTFTLREFTDLAVLAEPGGAYTTAAERLSALTAQAPLARPRRDRRAEDDIADPYGSGIAAYERAVAEISAAVTSLAAQLPAGRRTYG